MVAEPGCFSRGSFSLSPLSECARSPDCRRHPRLTKPLSVYGPHESDPGSLFKTQVLSRRHRSGSGEGTMKEREWAAIQQPGKTKTKEKETE